MVFVRKGVYGGQVGSRQGSPLLVKRTQAQSASLKIEVSEIVPQTSFFCYILYASRAVSEDSPRLPDDYLQAGVSIEAEPRRLASVYRRLSVEKKRRAEMLQPGKS